MGTLSDGAGGVLDDGDGVALSDGALPPMVYDARTALFFAAEVETYRPGAAAGTVDVLRVSDLGYRTRATDPGGVVAYPGVLDTAFEIDRKVALDPTQPGSRSDGALRIINLGQRFDAFTVPRNNDSRAVRLLVGQKRYDPARGIFLDPAYGDLRPFFGGTSASWLVGESELTIPLKDTSYWTSRPVQTRLYAGTGGLAGNEALTGRALPMTRGGTAALPVPNVSLVQVDPVANIWQWTDGPGTVVALYEAGAAVFARAGDVADLYAGATPPGSYRTCNRLGLLQLGSKAVGQITADVTGAFPVAGAVTTAVALAYALLTETLALPAQYADQAAFLALDAARPFVAGFFVADGTTTGLQVLQAALASVGARLSSTRSGQMQPFVIAPSLFGGVASRQLGLTNVVSVTPLALPANLDPPPYRWQVAFGRNYTVQSSGLNAAVADDPVRKQFLAAADRFALWADAGVSLDYLRPNDPPAIGTMLLDRAAAQQVADEAGALWRSRPGYYSVVVPLDVAAGLDVGSILLLTWPLGALAGGMLGQVVGEQVRSFDATATFEVLCISSIGEFSAEFGGEFSRGAP